MQNQIGSPIAVLGAGTIGASWAAYFLARGLDVKAWDPSPDFETSLQAINQQAQPVLQRLNLMADTPGQLTCHAKPEDAVADATFIQESAPERIEIKRDLYAAIAPTIGPKTILASSTSFIPPSELQEGQPFAERLVVGHPFNPPHLIPLVEVVGGKQTSSTVVDQAIAFYNAIGKRAIRLNREAPGHLVNRLQVALWREAVHALESGIASVEDIDAAIAYGPGLRWALMGPHMTFNLAGGDGGMRHFIDHLGKPNEAVWNDLGKPELTDDVAKLLIDGCDQEANGRSIAELREERDRQLVNLLEHTNRVS